MKGHLKASIAETYPDGSALVEIGKGESKLRVREIKARVRCPGKDWTDVRLWTSLLNWQKGDSKTLLKPGIPFTDYGNSWMFLRA